MNHPSGDREVPAEGGYGNLKYAAPRTAPKEFKPWHKPRKQFVRRNHLAGLLRPLLNAREAEDPLCYLGLPGTDLLDLRYLHEELCQESERPFRFLGFNKEATPGSPAQLQLSVSLDEVRRLPNVDKQSDVIHEDFRRISDQKSVAWSYARRLGPFDVINIDLCDGLASESPQNSESIYDAIALLMALQAKNPNPWILLITTRIGRRMFDTNAERRLMDHFRHNVTSCEGFAEACEQVLDANANSIDPEECSELDLLILMTAAIGKWLSKLAQIQGPSRVELARTEGYRVNPRSDVEDLVSLALRFDPVFEVPANPLSPAIHSPVDECDIAKAILRKASSRNNVDAILKMCPVLNEEMIVESMRLLAKARYNVCEYRTWLASFG